MSAGGKKDRAGDDAVRAPREAAKGRFVLTSKSRRARQGITLRRGTRRSRGVEERSFSVSVDTADLAVAAAFILAAFLLVASIWIDSWREAAGGALPYLVGVLTLAVGGVAAFRAYTKSVRTPKG